jgi:PTH1 family peptidyl-tRNA hydrolase
LDIPFGKFHIQKGVGPQLHNGLKSIEENLRSKDFWRVRIGVDARLPNRWIDGESYVLQNFLTEEKIRLEKEIFPIILNQLKIFLKTTFSIIF